jgi:hypothetical protein
MRRFDPRPSVDFPLVRAAPTLPGAAPMWYRHQTILLLWRAVNGWIDDRSGRSVKTPLGANIQLGTPPGQAPYGQR